MTNLEFFKEDIKRKLCVYGFDRAIREALNINYTIDEYKLLDWLCEEHQILDKEEKEYLSAVIRPFAYRIVDIMKIKDWIDEDSNFEVLEIALKLPGENPDMEFVHLPYFDKGTMYKGMKLDKPYTLKDLGL